MQAIANMYANVDVQLTTSETTRVSQKWCVSDAVKNRHKRVDGTVLVLSGTRTTLLCSIQISSKVNLDPSSASAKTPWYLCWTRMTIERTDCQHCSQ